MATKQQDAAAAKAAQIKAQNEERSKKERAERLAAKEAADEKLAEQQKGEQNVEQTIQTVEAENKTTDKPENDDNGTVHSGETADTSTNDQAENLEAKNEENKETTGDLTPATQSNGEEKTQHDFLSYSLEVTKQFGDQQDKVIESLSETIEKMFKLGQSIELAVPEIDLLYEQHLKPLENSQPEKDQADKESSLKEWWKDLLVIANEKGENLASRNHYEHYFNNGLSAQEAFKTEFPYHL